MTTIKTMNNTRIIKVEGAGFALLQTASDGRLKLRAVSATRKGIERAKKVSSKYFPEFTVKA